MQSDMFLNKISALIRQYLLPKNSPLRVFNPYFDEDGLIRIRERLRRVCHPEATKNPTRLMSSSAVGIQYSASLFTNDTCPLLS